jgi:thiol-disulfide isomerase/thioredoxin
MRRLLLAAVVLACAAGPALAAPAAPALTFKRLDGSGTFDSRALIGKKVLVVRFQASWCKVCAEEAPGIERIYEKYRTHGVELVAVHVQDTTADAQRFLKAHGATYPAGLDPQLSTATRFGVTGTPYTLIVNKRGEIVGRIAGRADEARLARALDPLVTESAKRRPPSRLQ